MAIQSRQSSQGHNTRRICNGLPCAAANYEIAANMQIEFAIKVVPLQLVVIRSRVRQYTEISTNLYRCFERLRVEKYEIKQPIIVVVRKMNAARCCHFLHQRFYA